MSVSLQVQSVIYHNEKYSLVRALTSIANAVRVNRETTGELGAVAVCYGDASAEPTFTQKEVEQIAEQFAPFFAFRYRYFNENTGSARGHNLLGAEGDSEYLMIMNPDVVLAPRFFGNMIAPFLDPALKAGMTEGRQSPVEHPKEYDKKTYETDWCTTACAVVPRQIFRELNGFDAETFFLYCDDLDFSWRVRLLGKKLYYRPDCLAYHSKTLSTSGSWQPTSAEVYYSKEAALLMAYKWSADKQFKKVYEKLENDGAEGQKAVARFEELKAQGKLPQRLDDGQKVAKFIGERYTEHRFVL